MNEWADKDALALGPRSRPVGKESLQRVGYISGLGKTSRFQVLENPKRYDN